MLKPPVEIPQPFFAVATIFGVDKETFSELDLPRFAEGFLAQSSDAQKGRNFIQVWAAYALRSDQLKRWSNMNLYSIAQLCQCKS